MSFSFPFNIALPICFLPVVYFFYCFSSISLLLASYNIFVLFPFTPFSICLSLYISTLPFRLIIPPFCCLLLVHLFHFHLSSLTLRIVSSSFYPLHVNLFLSLSLSALPLVSTSLPLFSPDGPPLLLIIFLHSLFSNIPSSSSCSPSRHLQFILLLPYRHRLPSDQPHSRFLLRLLVLGPGGQKECCPQVVRTSLRSLTPAARRTALSDTQHIFFLFFEGQKED